MTGAAAPPVARLLGGAALAPFLAGAASHWFSIACLSPQQGLSVAMTFGAVILSFLGGIRWGTTMVLDASLRKDMRLVGSVVAPLVGWASLFLSPVPGLCLLIAGFLLQALWDIASVERRQLPQWFGNIRMLLMAGAVLCLSAMLVHVAFS